MRVAIPALAGLSVLHGLVPPHPGPLIAIAPSTPSSAPRWPSASSSPIPTVIICGPLFSILAPWVRRRPRRGDAGHGRRGGGAVRVRAGARGTARSHRAERDRGPTSDGASSAQPSLRWSPC